MRVSGSSKPETTVLLARMTALGIYDGCPARFQALAVQRWGPAKPVIDGVEFQDLDYIRLSQPST